MVFRFLKRAASSSKSSPSAPVAAYDPVAETRRKLAAEKAAKASTDEGLLELLVDSVSTEAEGVIAITFVHPDGDELPEWKAGAHLELHLPSGLLRQYSLCSSPADRLRYRVSVLREEAGRGGSKELHDLDLVGTTMQVAGPRNHFELKTHERYLFIAGGIGVTPIRAMVESLPEGATYEVLYGGRTRASMAFVDELVEIAGERLTLCPQDECGLLDLSSALQGRGAETGVYCCGPSPLISAVEACVGAEAPEADLHFERFTASEEAAAMRAEKALSDREFSLELRRSGVTTTVPVGKSVLDAILEKVPSFDFSCEEGHCGSCLARIVEGTVDHRDEILSEEERAAQVDMYVCVSRATSDKLVLDV